MSQSMKTELLIKLQTFWEMPVSMAERRKSGRFFKVVVDQYKIR